MKKMEMQRGSDNVFADLGFSPEEAENLRVRSDLMSALIEIIRRRDLKQAQAAKMFGVSQPRVSDLTRGRIDKFSVDTLIAMLGAAGATVRVVVRDRRRVA